jgi:predicted phage tail protein
MAGGPAMVAGGIAAAPALILAPTPSGPSSLLSARVATPRYSLSAVAADSQVQLSWSPSSSGNDLAIYDAAVQDISKASQVGTATGTSAPVTGLTNGTTYYFWLVVPVDGGKVPNVVSNMASAIPVATPGPPAGLTATAGNAQVTLSWAPPASDGGSPVSGYIVFQGTSPGGETDAPVNGSLITGTSYTVTGLTNGSTYYFTVVAINAVGQSPPSAEASAIPVTVPGAPAGLTVTSGNAQVTLSWAAPASDGGSPVTGYNLYAGTTADFNGRAPVAEVTGTVVMVTGLVNGTTYYFRVTAVNRVGEGPASTEAKAVPVTVPGAPAGLTATPGNSRVTLAWTAPASGGAAISGYLIYQGTSPGGESGAPVNGSLVTGTSHTVTGLTNGTTYYFRVVAVNAVGQGPLSAEAPATLPSIVPSSTPASSATTPTAPASASTSAPAFAAPTGLTATAGNTQVRLSWTAPASDGGSSVISYKVYIATAPGVQGSRAIGSSKSTDATVTGLPNGTVYYFMVTAVNAAGSESPFSTEVSAEPPGPITGVTVSLNSPTPPKELIALLAAVAAMVAAGAFTLIARRGRRFGSRKHARPERSGQQMTVASDVRAVPDTSRPDVVSVRDTGREPTHTVRLEPHPGVTTTMIKEGRP